MYKVAASIRACKLKSKFLGFDKIIYRYTTSDVSKRWLKRYSLRWQRCTPCAADASALQGKSHYVLLFWELRGLSPNFHMHVSANDFYIPRIGPHISCSRIGRSIVRIYKSLTDTWMWKLGLFPRKSISGNNCFQFSLQCGSRTFFFQTMPDLISFSLSPFLYVFLFAFLFLSFQFYVIQWREVEWCWTWTLARRRGSAP
jgi:hypothetical protein